MNRLAYSALLLVVFLIGLAAGAWLSIGRRASNFSAGVAQRIANAEHAAPIPVPERKSAFPSEEEKLTAIMSAVAEEDPLLRAHLLHEALGRVSSADLAVLFERAVQVDDRDRRGVLLGVLLRRWAVVDPTAAAAAVRPYQDRFRAAVQTDWRSPDTAVCQAWARALPDRALAEAMASPNSQWARTLARSAIDALAEGDPLRQLEALAGLPPSRLRGEMCETAIKALAVKDTAAAEARLNLLPERRQRTRVLSEILGKLAERDPAAGLARLSALGPDLTRTRDGIQLVTSVLRAAAKKDPASALAAVDDLPEDLQEQARGPVLVGWAAEHPVEALTWAAANGVELSDAKSFTFFNDRGGAAWNTLLSTAFDSDRAKTLAWIREQPASAERDRMLREGIWGATAEQKLQIYAELTPSGQVRAVNDLFQSRFGGSDAQWEPWVKTLAPGAARQSAIRGLVASQANNAPERIDVMADAWPAGPERDAAIRGIVTTLSQNDPRRALDFARRVSGAEARESAFENVAQAWLGSDKHAARSWIASAPELSAEQKRVLLRQADER